VNPRVLARTVIAAPLLLVVVFDVYVIVFLVSNALSPELATPAISLPSEVTDDNFAAAWSQANLGRLAVNSMVIVVCAVALTLVASVGMAFAIARALRGRRTRSALRRSIVPLLAVPPTVLIVPIFYITNYLHLTNSRLGLMLVYAAWLIPFCTFILIRHFEDVPDELFEAAELDGADVFRQLYHIAMPSTRAALVTVGSLSALTIWNELLFGLLILQDPDKRTLTVGVALLQALFASSASQQTLSAAMVISIIPPLVLFALSSRRLIAGLNAGALK
jgi:ABC-type glycerol-3-phosphate transport system permease component